MSWRRLTTGPVSGAGSANAEGDKLVLTFRDAKGLLIRANNGQSGIMIAGEDRGFHDSTAEMWDNQILASNPSAPHPQHVRYLWADDPPVTIFNGEACLPRPFARRLAGLSDSKPLKEQETSGLTDRQASVDHRVWLVI